MTTDAPVFSIITVTKDNLRGFQATQGSMEAQSFKHYEWIVVDGNSMDGTKEHLPHGAVSEPDRGIYDAMNKGIERAKGDYLIFLNAGDLFADADILSAIHKAIKAERPDFIYGDSLEGGFYKKARPHAKIAWGMFTHHQAMMYRREAIAGLRYDPSLKIAADYGFTASFLKKVRSIHYMPCAFCIFEEGGVSQRNRKRGRVEQYRLRKVLGVCEKPKNIAVYLGQSASALCREYFPKIYQSLKAGR